MRERGPKSISLPFNLQSKVDLCAEAFRDAPGRPNYSAFVEWATDTVGSWLIENPGAFDRLAVREMLLRQAEERDTVQVAAINERQRLRAWEKERLRAERERAEQDLIAKRGELQTPEDVARVHWMRDEKDLRRLAAQLAFDPELVLVAARARRDIIAEERRQARAACTFDELVESLRNLFKYHSRAESERRIRHAAKRDGYDPDRLVEACWAAYSGRPQTSLSVVRTEERGHP